MGIHQHATLEDTVYFWFGANDTAGSGADGATPIYDVRLAGAAAGAAPVLSGSATLLSHANYPAGAHEVAIAATAANGFAADATYAVFCTLLVDSQNPTGFVGSFALFPIPATVFYAGEPVEPFDSLNPAPVNVLQWLDEDVPTSDTAGYPKVTIKDGTGTGEINTASGKVMLTSAEHDLISTGGSSGL